MIRRPFSFAAWILFLCIFARAQDVATVYVTNCAHCHGTDGRGNTPLGRALKPPDLRSPQIQALPEVELEAIIGKGAAQGKMPGFHKKLGDDAVHALAAYVHDLNRQPEPPAPARKRAKAVRPGDAKNAYAANCAHCHGTDGSGNTVLGREMKIRDLRTQAQALSDEDIKTVIANGSSQGRMPGFRKRLNAELVASLSVYVRSLSASSADADTQVRTPQNEASQSVTATSANENSALETTPSLPGDAHAPESAAKPEPSQKPIPREARGGATAGSHESPTPLSKVTGLIDLNSASKETLMTLPGLTEQDAVRIVQGRPYRSTLQFKTRRIIAPDLYDRIADRVIARQPKKQRESQ